VKYFPSPINSLNFIIDEVPKFSFDLSEGIPNFERASDAFSLKVVNNKAVVASAKSPRDALGHIMHASIIAQVSRPVPDILPCKIVLGQIRSQMGRVDSAFDHSFNKINGLLDLLETQAVSIVQPPPITTSQAMGRLRARKTCGRSLVAMKDPDGLPLSALTA
jgi:hypothetical protein